MPEIKRGAASNILRFTLKNSSTGAGLTGLTSSSAGLIISTICDNETTATVYTVTAGNVETITTLGAYAAPTAGKCRFKEVDAANHKGLYEFQFADARFSVASSKRLVISVTGATSLLDADYEVELPDNVEADTYNEVAFPNGAVVSDAGNTAVTFKTNLTQTADNHWKNPYLTFTTGGLSGQTQRVVGFNGTTKFITAASAYTGAPAATDTFILVNR